MTAPTIPGLEETIESSGNTRNVMGHAPSFELETALSDWFYGFLGQTWQRWPCGDEDCPARPAWDAALDEAVDSISWGVTLSIEAEVMALIEKRMTEFAERFQREHPEAHLREVEPSE